MNRWAIFASPYGTESRTNEDRNSEKPILPRYKKARQERHKPFAGRFKTMEEWFVRVWENLIARVSGPMHFRLFLQPGMAILFAIRDGLRDARAGHAPFVWSIFFDPRQRWALLREDWKATGRVFILACIMDVIYQALVLHTVYPVEVLLVAFILANLPYLLLRGLVTRLWRYHRPNSDKE